MDAQLEIKLIECLSQLDDGEPLDRILARYPDDATRLRPLLETATALATLRQEPSEMARIASRRVFLGQAHQLREAAVQRRFWLPRRWAMAIAALVVAVIFLGGTVAASALALPDEPLYGVKRVVEDAQLLVASSAQKEQLAIRFEQRRRDEVTTLLAMRRDTVIAFEGTIEAMQPDGLDISGLYVHLDRATTVAGMPAIGRRAEVQGRTESGQLIASLVRVEQGNSPPTSPTAQPTATMLPSETPSPVPAPSARPSPRAEVTQQPQNTARPTARPSAAPTRVPTNTPKPSATAVPPTPVPPTPVPPTPVPPVPVEEIEFSGVVEVIGPIWSVSGTPVEIDGSTEIRGTINIGDRVKVRARRLSDGRLIAQRIELQDDNDNANGNDDPGQNDNDNSGGDENDNSGSDGGGNDNGNDDPGGNDNDNSDGGGNDNGGGESEGNDNGNDDPGGNDNDNSGDDNGGRDDGDNGGGNRGSGGGDDKP